MIREPVLAEVLAVIGRDDQQRLSATEMARPFKDPHELPEMVVGVGQLPVVKGREHVEDSPVRSGDRLRDSWVAVPHARHASSAARCFRATTAPPKGRTAIVSGP